MNIVYATRATIPYASAASLNSVQMCQSLVQLGHRVTLAIGRKFWRPNARHRNWRRLYGFDPSFEIARLWELPRTGCGFDGGILRLASQQRALLYLRFPRILAHPAADSVPTLLELHAGIPAPQRKCVGAALSRGHLLGIVTITSALRASLLSDGGLAPYRDRIVVAPDAVDVGRFSEVDAALNLDQLGYVGSLYPGKGMEQIAAMARLRPHLSFHVFGGARRDVHHWRRNVADRPNLKLWGYVVPASVPDRYGQFGIALLPNQPTVQMPNGDDIGRYTSPMKMFEYMAAGRVIIASDLPGLREVLQHDVNCLLVAHNDPEQWVRAIDYVRRNPKVALRLARTAQQQARDRYTFDHRFRSILNRFEMSDAQQRVA